MRPGINQLDLQPPWAYCKIPRDIDVTILKEGGEMVVLCACCICQRGDKVWTLGLGMTSQPVAWIQNLKRDGILDLE